MPAALITGNNNPNVWHVRLAFDLYSKPRVQTSHHAFENTVHTGAWRCPLLTLMLLLDDRALLGWLALPGSFTDGDGPSAETVWRGVRATAPLKPLLGAVRGAPLGVGCREGVRGVCAMRGVATGVG